MYINVYWGVCVFINRTSEQLNRLLNTLYLINHSKAFLHQYRTTPNWKQVLVHFLQTSLWFKGLLVNLHIFYACSVRKSIKKLFIVHPTFWTRTVLFWSKPFIRYVVFNSWSCVYSFFLRNSSALYAKFMGWMFVTHIMRSSNSFPVGPFEVGMHNIIK